jgi:chromate transport protein ChrA
MAILRSPLFRLWILANIPWLFSLPYLARSATRPEDLILVALLTLVPPTVLTLGLAWTWKRFGKARWLLLPEHLRRGLLRLYLAITLPWVVWFSYRISEELQRHQYGLVWRYISGSVWSLVAVPIGGPILLFVFLWVVAGFRPSASDQFNDKPKGPSPSSARDPKSRKERSSQDVVPPTKSPDYRERGSALARVLMDPDDCWRDVCKLRGYKAPGPVATCEMAFARAAIIKHAITNCQPEPIADLMIEGVNNYVADAFSGEDTDEVLDYYEARNGLRESVLVIALRTLRFYEQHVFPLTHLSGIFAHRLSVPGLAAIEIAPFFEEVAAEAEQLMRMSASAQKLNAHLSDSVSEAKCVLCRDLDPAARQAMRADLLQIPLREAICDQCMEAFSANLFASFPKTEEERLRRRVERAATNKPKQT